MVRKIRKLKYTGQDIPNVGKIQVSGKNVVMGPPTVFTKANYNQFPF
jgi:hypothetical protein